ncbi:hypothetical protein B0J11DRAFT_80629 [Dendryphion nanum]|uniref:Uncharacterized protein n=1 Tax=Dendryphion nanum TaxID=256645 RepID=A0A9P9DH63_9PLEO|nr:hypothetical protein B0J11DRAFT_80629 [Dendryphion nanum]
MVLFVGTAALATLVGFATAIGFPGPQPTPVIAEKLGDYVNGWSPRPTSRPLTLPELFKRQQGSPEFCGYLEGDPEYPVTCRAGRSCLYDDNFRWFGCCTGTRITDCAVVTACVESTKIPACVSDPSCREDPYLTACSSRNAPYCMLLYSVITRTTYGHFECASARATFQVVRAAITGPGSSLRSATGTRNTRLSFSDVEESRGGFQFSTRPTDDSSLPSTPSSSGSSSSTRGTSTTQSLVTSGGSAGSVTFNPNTATPTSSTGAAAMRTAEVVLGAAGGVVGLLAIFL